MSSKKINRIVFQHIPKTGGTTLHEVLVHELGLKVHPERHTGFWREDLDSLSSFELFSGHMVKQDIDHLKKLENRFLVTVLRDPVDRYISEYDYLRTRPKEAVRRDSSGVLAKVRNQNPEQFFSQIIREGIDNKITRTIAGYKPLNDTEVGATLDYFEEFDLVGISCYLDECIEIVFEALGHEREFKPRFANSSLSFINRDDSANSFQRTSRDAISNDMWEALTWADKKLYEHFKARFETHNIQRICRARIHYAAALARELNAR